MDYSNYDATQSAFLRACIDETIATKLIEKQLILGDVNIDEIKPYLGNIRMKFKKSYSSRKFCIFKALGKLFGTTYSGHPTCTSCFGTLRNLFYNALAIKL